MTTHEFETVNVLIQKARVVAETLSRFRDAWPFDKRLPVGGAYPTIDECDNAIHAAEDMLLAAQKAGLK